MSLRFWWVGGTHQSPRKLQLDGVVPLGFLFSGVQAVSERSEVEEQLGPKTVGPFDAIGN